MRSPQSFFRNFRDGENACSVSNSNLAAEKLANLLISEIFIFPGGGSFAFGRSDANQQRSTVVRMRAICRWLRRNSAFALLRPQRVAMSSSWESGSEQLRHASKPKTCCAVYRHRIPRRHDGVAQSGGRSRNADADAPYYDQKVQSAKLPEFPRTDFTIGSYATARPNGRRRGKK